MHSLVCPTWIEPLVGVWLPWAPSTPCHCPLTRVPQGYLTVNVETGETQKYFLGVRCFAEEPVLVPAPSRAPPGPMREEDAYLLGLSYDGERGRTALCIFEAANVSKGPVCRVWLRGHLPHGLHGSWSPDPEAVAQMPEQVLWGGL